MTSCTTRRDIPIIRLQQIYFPENFPWRSLRDQKNPPLFTPKKAKKRGENRELEGNFRKNFQKGSKKVEKN